MSSEWSEPMRESESVDKAGDEFRIEAVATPKKPQRNHEEKYQSNCGTSGKAAAGRTGI